MNTRIKQAVATVAVSAAAVTGSALAAPAADAKVDPGKYTYTAYSWGVFPLAMPARVQGNTLITYEGGRTHRQRIHLTPTGGWLAGTNGGDRIYLHKQRGYKHYRGDIKFRGIPIGHVTLTHRR